MFCAVVSILFFYLYVFSYAFEYSISYQHAFLLPRGEVHFALNSAPRRSLQTLYNDKMKATSLQGLSKPTRTSSSSSFQLDLRSQVFGDRLYGCNVALSPCLRSKTCQILHPDMRHKKSCVFEVVEFTAFCS